jgi:hypothetical protein
MTLAHDGIACFGLHHTIACQRPRSFLMVAMNQRASF